MSASTKYNLIAIGIFLGVFFLFYLSCVWRSTKKKFAEKEAHEKRKADEEALEKANPINRLRYATAQEYIDQMKQGLANKLKEIELFPFMLDGKPYPFGGLTSAYLLKVPDDLLGRKFKVLDDALEEELTNMGYLFAKGRHHQLDVPCGVPASPLFHLGDSSVLLETFQSEEVEPSQFKRRVRTVNGDFAHGHHTKIGEVRTLQLTEGALVIADHVAEVTLPDTAFRIDGNRDRMFSKEKSDTDWRLAYLGDFVPQVREDFVQHVRMEMLTPELTQWLKERFPGPVRHALAYRAAAALNVVFYFDDDEILILSDPSAYHYLTEYQSVQEGTLVDQLFKIDHRLKRDEDDHPRRAAGTWVRRLSLHGRKITWFVGDARGVQTLNDLVKS